MGERLKRAIERGHSQLEDVCSSFSGIHHFTLGAIARRGGRFQGSSGSHDLPSAISKPVLDSIAFAWSEYFGEALVIALDKANVRLLKIAGDNHLAIGQILKLIEEIDAAFHARLSEILAATEKILEERLNQAKAQSLAKIEQTQRELYETIPGQIRANMQNGFSLAAQERGTGMKKRMVKIISEHANQVSSTMFEDIQAALLDAVRGLNDWMQRQHLEMTDTVRTQSDTATTNLRHDAHAMSLAEMEAQRVLIANLEKALIEIGSAYGLVSAHRQAVAIAGGR